VLQPSIQRIDRHLNDTQVAEYGLCAHNFVFLISAHSDQPDQARITQRSKLIGRQPRLTLVQSGRDYLINGVSGVFI
jgi:hypothetical protein